VALVASAPAAVSLVQARGCVAIGIEVAELASGVLSRDAKLDLAGSAVALVLHPSSRLPGPLRARCDTVVAAGDPPTGGMSIPGLAQTGLAEVGRLRPSVEV
jgi:hypothetical protein